MQTDKNLDLINADSLTLASEAVKILLEKKGLDVRMYDVRESSAITDFYVNATGRSSTQVGALADDVAEQISERGMEPLHVEGRRANEWLLIDYGNVIVNVFDKPSRDFYDFDRHLPEGSRMDITDLIAEVDAKFDLNRK